MSRVECPYCRRQTVHAFTYGSENKLAFIRLGVPIANIVPVNTKDEQRLSCKGCGTEWPSIEAFRENLMVFSLLNKLSVLTSRQDYDSALDNSISQIIKREADLLLSRSNVEKLRYLIDTVGLEETQTIVGEVIQSKVLRHIDV